jgi:TonB family protein
MVVASLWYIPELRLMHMTRVLICAIATLSLCGFAQCASNSAETNSQVIITNLAAPMYPALALQARITGTVKLNVTISASGSVESLDVVSGHPLLTKAAVDSIHQAQFQCRECKASVTFLMTYHFEVGEAVYCTHCDAQCEKPEPRVTQSQNTVTIVDRPVATCDPVGTIVKVRSAKCLFLWRCGKRYPM